MSALLLFSMGCATRVAKVKAIEGETAVPYNSLGTLEIKINPWVGFFPRLYWTTIKGLTLGLMPTPSRGEIYKSALRKRLARKAEKSYDADAVIGVTYWPNPEAKRLAEKNIFARGEMIKYTPFPQTSHTEEAVQEIQKINLGETLALPPTSPTPSLISQPTEQTPRLTSSTASNEVASAPAKVSQASPSSPNANIKVVNW